MRANIRKVIEGTVKLVLHTSEHDIREDAWQNLRNLSDVEIITEAATYDYSMFDTICEEENLDSALEKLLSQLRLMNPYPVPDDAMAPTLPRGGMVCVETCDYKDGDYLYFRIHGHKVWHIRQAYQKHHSCFRRSAADKPAERA